MCFLICKLMFSNPFWKNHNTDILSNPITTPFHTIAAMTEVQLSLRAYAKILSHVVQYPYTAVNGVLLARDDEEEDTELLDVVDAVPLFHYNLSLTPMLTVALTQIEEYATNRSMKIAGYYHANEYCNDSEVR